MTLQVWDIGGQTMGGNMLDKYVSGAHVSLCTSEAIVCDVIVGFRVGGMC